MNATDEFKKDLYTNAIDQISAVLQQEGDLIARMATTACVLKSHFPYFFWCGFYIVDSRKNDQELVIGPYQGTLGCLRIPFGKGVCGTVAASRRSMVVADVHEIANHIACDARSRSEIVVPVTAPDGTLIAVLDVDSDQVGAFNDTDRIYLEQIAELVGEPGKTGERGIDAPSKSGLHPGL